MVAGRRWIGFGGGVSNLYEYCLNDPVNYFDPDGLQSLTDIRDFTAGFISSLSLGLSDLALDALGDLGKRNECSGSYSTGEIAGTIAAVAAGGKGLFNLFKGAAKGVGRVFWTGGKEAMKEAAKFASQNGMVTLEMTNVGKTLSTISKVLPYKIMKPLWKIASRRFAKEAQGVVHFFSNGVEPGLKSIWRTVERPILEGLGIPIIPH